MFPASGPGAPQAHAQPPAPAWTPPQQHGFTPPQQQGFKPPQQGFPPQPAHGQPAHGHPQHGHPPHAQPPSAYAPGAPHAHGHPQQPYSPHQATPQPTPPPAAAAGGKKGGKGLIIGLALAAVAIAGGVIAFVAMGGDKPAKGGDSYSAVVKGALAAMAAGDAERLIAMGDPVTFYDKVADCSKRKDDEKDEDKDKAFDPKRQREEMKKEYEKLVERTKGAKIELVEIITKEPKAPKDDEEPEKKDKADGDEEEDFSRVMKSGERMGPGCYSKVPTRSMKVRMKVKVTPPNEKAEMAFEHKTEMRMLQVGTGWYVMSPPRIRLGGGALIKELTDVKEKVCNCGDYACAKELKEKFKRDREDSFEREMKDLSDKDKDTLDAIEDEIKKCEKKLNADGQLSAMQTFKDKLCECTNKTCADKVMKEIDVWSRSQDFDKDLDERFQEKSKKLGEEMVKCTTRIYSAGTGGGIGSTIAEAGTTTTGGSVPMSASGLPQACEDYRTAVAALAVCAKLPAETREAYEKTLKAMDEGWAKAKNLPPDAAKTMADACQKGLEAYKESTASLGC